MANTTAVVAKLPKCDFCTNGGVDTPAHFDGKTLFGPWAYMCSLHFAAYGVGLGLGVGQKLIVKETE